MKQTYCITVIKKNNLVSKNRISKFMIFSNKKIKELLRNFEAQTLEKNKELEAQSKIKVPYKKKNV